MRFCSSPKLFIREPDGVLMIDKGMDAGTG
jgi:hypothetical protein